MKSNIFQTKLVQLIAPFFIVLFLAGCSGPPSEGVGKQIVEKQIQDQSKGLIKLLSFRKTNSTGNDAAYQVEYEVEIEFADTVLVYQDPGIYEGPFYAERGTLTASKFMFQQRTKGEKVKQTGTLGFVKTEKGWRGQDGNVY